MHIGRNFCIPTYILKSGLKHSMIPKTCALSRLLRGDIGKLPSIHKNVVKLAIMPRAREVSRLHMRDSTKLLSIHRNDSKQTTIPNLIGKNQTAHEGHLQAAEQA